MLVHGFVRRTRSQGDAVTSMTETGQILPSCVVAILAFEGVQPIDISGPAQGFTTANEEGATPPYSVHVVGPEPGVMRTASGFGITVKPYPSSSVDTLVVPGGPGIHAIRKNPAWLTLVADMTGRSGRVCSVCTEAFVMAAASLLDGRRAVTHWRSCDLPASDHPGIVVDPDPIFIEDGKYWTTAGVTAGIDLTLALIERDHGAALASRVARRPVEPMRRPGGQKQFSEMLDLQSKDAAPFEALLRAVAAHLARDWSVEAMAAAVGQSPRNFHRRFEAATQTTPAQAVKHIRAEMARTLLQTTELQNGPPLRHNGEVRQGKNDGDQHKARAGPRTGKAKRSHPSFHASPRQTSSPPSTSRPTKKHSRNVSGRTRARSHPPNAMPASAGTRASSEAPAPARVPRRARPGRLQAPAWRR